MAVWAHRSLAEKNRLTATDAERVEQAFEARLVTGQTTKALVLDTDPTHYKILPAACSKGVTANRQQ